MAKKLVRLSESELKGLVNRTTQRILKEGNEVRLAHRMKESIIALNNALLKDIRKEQ